MPDLLLELFSEEIPARMQAKAADDLKKMVTDRLVDAGLVYEGRARVRDAAPPDAVRAGRARAPAGSEGRAQGPARRRAGGRDLRVSQGGRARVDRRGRDPEGPKKGDFYIALTEKPGCPAIDVIGEFLQVVLRTFPWPKSMRWGEQSATPGSSNGCGAACDRRDLRARDEEPDIVHVQVAGIKSGNTTYGHRFMSPGAIQVRHFGDYVANWKKRASCSIRRGAARSF